MEYTSDICPFCGSHMGMFVTTYAFNFLFVSCSRCGGISQSAYEYNEGTTFRWIIPDGETNQLYVEVHKMVSGVTGEQER